MVVDLSWFGYNLISFQLDSGQGEYNYLHHHNALIPLCFNVSSLPSIDEYTTSVSEGLLLVYIPLVDSLDREQQSVLSVTY